MNRRSWGLIALLWTLSGVVESAEAASLIVRRQQDGASQFAVQVGEVVDLEVAIEAGAEEITGVAFYLSFASDLFRLVPARKSAEGLPVPFVSGGFLGGIELVNEVEQIGNETFLNYTEGVPSGQHRGVSGQGVIARFRLEAVRRSPGNATYLRIEARGHDRTSHYVTATAPGVEHRFAEPQGQALVRIIGFRLFPLPDVVVIEGESQRVFDLDAFVDATLTQVLWTHSQLSEVPTAIDPRTHEVFMSPLPGQVGRWAMIFTAFESTEGLTAADTIAIEVRSRPKIAAEFPDTICFPEDALHQELDLDAFVQDADDLPSALSWIPLGGIQVQVTIDPDTHIATFAAAPDFFGEERISLVVRDATALSDTAALRVVVSPVNDPPETRRLLPVYPVQDGGAVAVPLAALVEDRDDPLENLSFALEAEAGVEAEIQGEVLSIRGKSPGRWSIDIAVQDTAGARAATRQTAVVLEPGQAARPKIRRLPEIRLLGGRSCSLELRDWVRDDSPVDSLIWEAKPGDGLIALLQNGRLQVGGKSGFSGTSQVLLTATDPAGNQDQAVLSVRLLRPEDGLGPKIYDPGKIGLRREEGRVVLPLDQWVDDPDDRDSEIEWEVLPTPGLAYDPRSRTLQLKPGETLIQPAAVTLKARDPAGGRDELTVPVLVAVPAGPPRMREFPEISLDRSDAEARFDLDEYAFDDEDFEEELTWTAVAEPGVDVKVDPANHLLRVRRSQISGPQPSVVQVLLQVEDTAGLANSRILKVGLPPLFALQPLPAIQLVAGRVDSSLVLDDFVTSPEPGLELKWSASPGQQVTASIDPVSHRVRVAVKEPSFQGSETLNLTAVDLTGRSLTVPLRVVVKGPGLSPQLKGLPTEEIEQGQDKISIDLDDFVIDDDPDSVLQWSVSGQRTLAVEIDPRDHVVTLKGGNAVPGVEQLQFLVCDPAGNLALGIMEVVIVRGGQAPVILPLPQLIMPAGGPEQQLELKLFAQDPDTPVEALVWEAAAEPGVAARLEGSRLIVSVPAGQRGMRQVQLAAADPQGNRGTAVLQILIQEDAEAPVLALEVARHPVFGEYLEVWIRSSEELREAPRVSIDTLQTLAERQEDGRYRAIFPFPPQERERLIEIAVQGTDRGGNETRRKVIVALGWMDRKGGRLSGPDPQVLLHVPDAAAGPGHLAILYRLGEPEIPPGSGEGPVYAVDLFYRRPLPHPVTLNFFAGPGADPNLGILRWNERKGGWEEVPTWVDAGRGWLSALVDELGLFRLGEVDPQNRQASPKLYHYPNPFSTRSTSRAQIAYQVSLPGAVRLEIFDLLGQRVRLLVDEFQEVGTWNAQWDGRDSEGREVGSGLYFYELTQGGERQRRSLILIR